MRRRILAVVAVVAAALTTACGGQSGAGDEPERLSIAIVSKGFQHQFWQAVKEGADQAAAAQGVDITFEGPASETEVEQQVTMLTNALSRGPDAIGLAALDSRATAPLLAQARSQNIPVIAFDSGVDSDIPVTTAATDNKAAAAAAAEKMAQALGGSGQVAMVVHDQTSRSGIDRRDGFTEWMAANAPGIEVLEPQYGAGDQARSADITKAILAGNPGVRGVYAANEGSAIGMIRGVAESGRTDLVLVGFDSGEAQINAIRDGVMLGAVTQNPVGMGAELVDSAVAAVRGEQLPKVIDTGFFWYDRSNIDAPEIQAVLYQ